MSTLTRSRSTSARLWATRILVVALAGATFAPNSAVGAEGDPIYIGAYNNNQCIDPCWPGSQPFTDFAGAVAFPRSVLVVRNVYDGTNEVSGPAGHALTGEAEAGSGLFGLAHGAGAAVLAENTSSGAGLLATSRFGDGVVSSTAATNRSGVYGNNTGGGGWGVVGRTNAEQKPAVWGDNTGRGNGVHGSTSGNLASGVYGSNSAGGYGVAGRTGASTRAGTLGDNTGTGPGVQGESRSGNGVFGFSHGAGASGVYGENDAGGYGVAGRSNAGIGVLATSTSGTALAVDGVANFSRSGTIVIPAGRSRIVVSGVSLSAASFAIATLQQNRAGIWVQSAVPSAAGDTLTIYLNKAVTSNTRVAWFILD
jgi:hypothetical protein